MDEKMLTALQGSIEKWRAIVNGTGLDKGAENCPLCAEYKDAEDPESDPYGDEVMCYGCPVSEKSGMDGCVGTPYDQWAEYLSDKGRLVGSENRKVFDTVSAALAQSELDFLTSLLPIGHAAGSEGK